MCQMNFLLLLIYHDFQKNNIKKYFTGYFVIIKMFQFYKIINKQTNKYKNLLIPLKC